MPETHIDSAFTRLTLRFKNYKTTVFLTVCEHQTIDSIKKLLLEALKNRGIEEINGVHVPDPNDTNQVVLGLPNDKRDLKKGWSVMEPPKIDVELDSGALKTKSKRQKRRAEIDSLVFPTTFDIKDGNVLAFAFQPANRSPSKIKFDVIIPEFDDEKDGNEDEDEEDDNDEDDEKDGSSGSSVGAECSGEAKDKEESSRPRTRFMTERASDQARLLNKAMNIPKSTSNPS